MKFHRRVRNVCLIVCMTAVMLFQNGIQSVQAETGGNAPYYTYVITVYAGKEGTFADGSSEMKLTGLSYGEVVSLNTCLSSVQVKDADKYYVKGIRESGRDNNTVSYPAFKVECDREYVVAYGIKGNMTTYTVNYQDQDGHTLLPGETFYGVVGDQAVVAYHYIEGYRPQAYNLEKTLSSHAEENVLTFTYQKTAQDEQAHKNNPETDETNTATTENGTTEGVTTDTVESSEAPAADVKTSETADITGNSTTKTDTADAEGKDTPANAGTEDEGDAPEDLVNLDKGDVPLANVDTDKATGRPIGVLCVMIVLAVAAVAALLVLLLIIRKKGKTKRE